MNTPSAHAPLSARSWALLVVLSILWGGSFFFNAILVKELPTLTILLGRLSIGALLLISIYLAQGGRLNFPGSVWRAFALMGLMNNLIPMALIIWGQSHIASGLASILNATTPLFTLVVLHMLSDEKITGLKALGVTVGFIGVIILIGGAALDTGGTKLLAILGCLAAALSYGFAGWFGRRFITMKVPPLAIAIGQTSCSALILLPFTLLIDRPWLLPNPSLIAWGALIGVAALATALAYLLFFKLLERAGAANLSLVTFLIPVSAILLGVLVLGERLEPRHLAGMVFIALGLMLIDGRLFQRRP